MQFVVRNYTTKEFNILPTLEDAQLMVEYLSEWYPDKKLTIVAPMVNLHEFEDKLMASGWALGHVDLRKLRGES